MEISPFELYFIFKLDEVRSFLAGLTGAAVGLVLPVAIVAGICAGDSMFPDTTKKAIKILVVLLGVSVTASAVRVAVPSTQQMAAIYILPPIINNERVQKIPSQLLDTLGLTLDTLNRGIGTAGAGLDKLKREMSEHHSSPPGAQSNAQNN